MNRVEIVGVSGYTGIMTIEGFSGDAMDFGSSTSSTSDLANRSPYGLDIGFMIKSAKSFLITPCDIFTDLNRKSVCFLYILPALINRFLRRSIALSDGVT